MRHQRVRAVAGTAAMMVLLAACGSDAEKSVPGPNFATVTGGGQNLDFPAGIERREYPNACTLVPANSMQALIGAPVTSNRTVAGCAWTAGEASLPTVAIQFVEIGSDAAEVYAQRRPGGGTARSVDGVGERSRIYRVNDNKTTRLDLLEPRAFVRIEVRSALTTADDLRTAEQIATRVAQLVAQQVR